MPDCDRLISQVIDELLHPKPYLVCICGNFALGEYDAIHERVRCKRCGGWRRVEELVSGGRSEGMVGNV